MSWIKKLFKKKTVEIDEQTNGTIMFNYCGPSSEVPMSSIEQKFEKDLNGWNHVEIIFNPKNPIPQIEITSENGTKYHYVGLVEDRSKLDPTLHHLVWSEKDGEMVEQPKCPMCDASNSFHTFHNPEHPDQHWGKCELCGHEDHFSDTKVHKETE